MVILILPSFRSLNPFETFFRPLRPHSSSHNCTLGSRGFSCAVSGFGQVLKKLFSRLRRSCLRPKTCCPVADEARRTREKTSGTQGITSGESLGNRRFRLYIENAVARNKPRTRSVSEWVKKIAIRSWVELHFTIISYILSFNYSYRYEINLIRIIYATNSSILYSKEKTGQIVGTWHQYLVNVSCLRYSKQIEFQEELINFLRTWLF